MSERALSMPVYRVAVRPNDSRRLTDIRATNDDELQPLVVVFEEIGDVVMGGDRKGMDLGIPTPQLLSSAFQLVVQILRFDTKGEYRRFSQRRPPSRGRRRPHCPRRRSPRR
jgi:hypothetical protein